MGLLPETDIEALELPLAKTEKGPPDNLEYYHLDEDAIEIEQSGAYVDKGRSLELDMFAGKQTMGERAESYKVQQLDPRGQ